MEGVPPPPTGDWALGRLGAMVWVLLERLWRVWVMEVDLAHLPHAGCPRVTEPLPAIAHPLSDPGPGPCPCSSSTLVPCLLQGIEVLDMVQEKGPRPPSGQVSSPAGLWAHCGEAKGHGPWREWRGGALSREGGN